MNQRHRTLVASGGVVVIFLLVQVGALALVEPFQAEGHQVVEDTGDPTISVLYIGAILVVTALMLAAIKYGGTVLIKWLVIFAGGYITFWVLDVVAPDFVTVTVGGAPVDLIAVGGGLLLGAALALYPEWYVIDAAGIIMGIGAAGLFGINFGLLPALLLLAALAVYDAISVYGTEHMLTLASGVMELRIPVVLVVPLTLSYSFLDDDATAQVTAAAEEGATETPDVEANGGGDVEQPSEDAPPLDAEQLNRLGAGGVAEVDEDDLAAIDDETLAELDEPVREALEERIGERDALFIGLGDAVIPTILVASAAVFIESGPAISLLGIGVTLPALTAMAGTVAGLVVLLWMVLKGRAHAGLPLLNGGAIGGYLVGALVSGLTLAEALGLSGGVF
ncbi:MAG: presenilin family intramembrane aspartyl protease PSH [Halovenus sp.]